MHFLLLRRTSFVGADGAGGGGPDALGVDHLHGDGVARERQQPLQVEAPRPGVVQHHLAHVLLGAAGVLVVLPAEELAVNDFSGAVNSDLVSVASFIPAWSKMTFSTGSSKYPMVNRVWSCQGI